MPEHQRRYLSSHIISSNICINNNDVSSLLTESIIRRFSGVSNEASTKRGDKNEVVANSIKSSIVESETDKSMGEKVTATIKYIISLLLKTPGILGFYLRNPAELKQKIAEIKHLIVKEVQHYWMGTKLLAADIRTARKILLRTMGGSSLTRRERKQLLRTTSDLFRIIPFSMFLIIPFMEFALPFALRIFPNMLPSTFQDSYKAEENMKRELKIRLEMAGFMQETLQNLAKDQKRKASGKLAAMKDEVGNVVNRDDSCEIAEKEATAEDFLEFLDDARGGKLISPDVIIRFAKYFKDELTLDQTPRTQLVNLCTYMGIAPYGSDPLLRFQLRHKIRGLKEDDQRILWEGIESLSKMELREACQERGMRSTGLSKNAYRLALQQWLDLSVNKDIPVSLLISSRTFFLHENVYSLALPEDAESKSVAGIADAISAMDRDLVNEVILEVATSEEKQQNPEVIKISLEVLEAENERIQEELEERNKIQAKKLQAEEEEVAAKKKAERNEMDDSANGSEFAALELDHSAEMANTIETNPSHSEAAVKDASYLRVDEGIEKTAPVEPSYTYVASTSEATEDAKNIGDCLVDVATKQAEAKASDDEDEVEAELSPEELDAISQLISPNAMDKERAELERIKTAMSPSGMNLEPVPNDITIETQRKPDVAPGLKTSQAAPSFIDGVTKESFEKEAVEAAKEAEVANLFMTEAPSLEVSKILSAPADASLDKTMSRLQSKVESMVGKIELQLYDAEAKIGNKLHFLDKDMDGILSAEEVAQCLQLVLRRDLTFEEAMDIATGMDANEDGFFTIDELNRWIETNKIVALVGEGRDAEVDREIECAKEQSEKRQMAAVDGVTSN